MSEPAQHFFDAPNLSGQGTHRIAYYEWGNPASANVAICVHGLTRNGRDFDFVAADLAQDFRVIAVDVAGRGQSDNMASPLDYHYGTYCADMLALLGHLGITRCQWVGTSMGGIIGMTLAATAPGLISHMVLNDVGSFIPKEALTRIFTYIHNLPVFATPDAAKAHMKNIFAPFGIRDEPTWEHLFRHSLRTDASTGQTRLAFDPRLIESVRIATEEFTKVEDVDLSALWQTIAIPVLLLRGEWSDILLPETVSAMRAVHPQLDYVEIPGVGHAPSLMYPEQIQIVSGWMRSHLSAAMP